MTSSKDLIRQALRGTQSLPRIPSKHRAVLTCMDTRIDPLAALGLQVGDAHILRNAGGIVTADVVRSLTVSQRELGTSRIDVVMHTKCGMLDLDERRLRDAIAADAGARYDGTFGSFSDLEAELRRGVELLANTPSLADTTQVRGHILDVDTGRTRLVIS